MHLDGFNIEKISHPGGGKIPHPQRLGNDSDLRRADKLDSQLKLLIQKS